jgi:predicted  nucleic acid-binding Zn-ribbon protein
MLDSVKALLDLQLLDLRIAELRELSEAVPRDVVSKRDIAALAERRLNQADEAIKNQQKENSQLELEVKSFDDKVTKLEVQLNAAKTNKEFQTLKDEIGGIRADQSRMEDKVLEGLNQVDALRAKRERIAADVEKARKVLAEVAGEAEQRTSEVKKEMEIVEAERAEKAETLDKGLVSQYERILESKSGSAVVAIRGGVCQGCFVNVTQQCINLALQESEIVRCNNCKRIVYLDDKEAAVYRA